MQQEFRFEYESPDQVRTFLQSLAADARMDVRGDGFVVFTANVGAPGFSFDVAIVPQGLLSVRHGDYFEFLGLFIEALTGTFGPVTIEDAWPG